MKRKCGVREFLGAFDGEMSHGTMVFHDHCPHAMPLFLCMSACVPHVLCNFLGGRGGGICPFWSFWPGSLGGVRRGTPAIASQRGSRKSPMRQHLLRF